MQPSLNDSYLRIKRGKQHIASLRQMQKRLAIDHDDIVEELHSPADDVVPDADGVVRVDLMRVADAGETLRRLWQTPKFVVPSAPPPNPQWSIRFGECVYNLRAALDYLVYSLAHLDSGGEQEGTQFPIFDTPTKFQNGTHVNHPKNPIRGVSPPHVAAIEDLQPYPGRNGLDPHWLARLADFSNPDKHRRLTAVSTRTSSTTSWSIGGAMRGKMKVEFAATRHISLGDTEKTPVIPTLDSLVAHVTETLDEFAPCFEGECAHPVV